MRSFLDLFRKRRAYEPPARTVYAIGDIHGRKDLLERLVRLIKDHAGQSDHELVFLGDYIDRGPDSAGVVDFLLHSQVLRDTDCTFLKGNHEATLLDFLDTPEVGPSWGTYGGLETLLSYGVQDIGLSKNDAQWAETSQRFRQLLPADHLQFYQTLERFTRRGEYLFVHAGVDPDKPLDEQTDSELLWIRDAFLNDTRQYDYMIVHGHTPQSAPSKDNRRIGLDTGAYQTGLLTAAAISASGVEFISTR